MPDVIVVQVVEIAHLTTHCLDECEKKAAVGRCPRCWEAFPKADLKNHTAAKTCPREYIALL